ncbi:MAG: methionyl-tRNA formyltransferase [Clostridiales bacterium]|nr:methionyl-tRNA formyltransferase [Clostridiales bacterium]
MSDIGLRIAYMGSADFAVPALDALRTAGHDIAFVVTQPDKARGRGGKILPTPVGLYAETYGLPLLKPERVKDNPELEHVFAKTSPDLIVVAAYGKLLPASLLGLPPLGCINIHASLLPEYRGAAPVQQAILDGRAETGVTLMHVVERLDAGDIIASARVEVAGMTAGELTAALAQAGAKLLVDTLPAIADGTAPRVPQNEAKATYAEKIAKADGHLDLTKSAEEAALRVRAMTPAPGAYVMRGDERIVLTAARAVVPEECGASITDYKKALPGTVLAVSKKGVAVRTGHGALLIEALKMPAKKAMPVAEYLKGNAFDKDTPLE